MSQKHDKHWSKVVLIIISIFTILKAHPLISWHVTNCPLLPDSCHSTPGQRLYCRISMPGHWAHYHICVYNRRHGSVRYGVLPVPQSTIEQQHCLPLMATTTTRVSISAHTNTMCIVVPCGTRRVLSVPTNKYKLKAAGSWPSNERQTASVESHNYILLMDISQPNIDPLLSIPIGTVVLLLLDGHRNAHPAD